MMTPIKPLAAAAASLLVLFLSSMGCGRTSTPTGERPEENGLTPVTIQLNWYPEAEHGGVYAAEASGLYEAAGLDVTIRAGGQGTRVAPELAMGRADFAFANADDVVLFREEGVDVVAVLAAMQDNPRCILVRADSGVDSFEGLRGMTLQRQAGRPFLAFLRSRGLLEDVREVPYAGSVAELVTNKQTAIQAYSIAEPYLAQQQGVDVRMLMVSELGWNPYCSVLITSGAMIREQPEVVRRVVQATRQGWQQYLQDPTEGNAAILAANQHGMTAEALQFGSEALRELALPDGVELGEAGTMSAERWQTLVDQMAELDLVDPERVKADECFTTRFLD